MGLFRRKDKNEFDIKKTIEKFGKDLTLDRADFISCPDWLEPEYDETGKVFNTPDIYRRNYRNERGPLRADAQAF